MKKIFSVITLGIVLLTPSIAMAKEVTIAIPEFNVSLGDKILEREYGKYPPILYNNITYYPMTHDNGWFIGIHNLYNQDTNTLDIKSGFKGSEEWYNSYKSNKKNPKNLKATISTTNIVVNGKKIDNTKEEYPVLNFRNVTYFPMTWRFMVDEFKMNYSFDEKSGLLINSNSETIAEKIEEKESAGSLETLTENYTTKVVKKVGEDAKNALVVYPNLYYKKTDGFYIFDVNSNTSKRIYAYEGDGNLIREEKELFLDLGHLGSTKYRVEEGKVSQTPTEKSSSRLSKKIKVGNYTLLVDWQKEYAEIEKNGVSEKAFKKIASSSNYVVKNESVYFAAGSAPATIYRYTPGKELEKIGNVKTSGEDTLMLSNGNIFYYTKSEAKELVKVDENKKIETMGELSSYGQRNGYLIVSFKNNNKPSHIYVFNKEGKEVYEAETNAIAYNADIKDGKIYYIDVDKQELREGILK